MLDEIIEKALSSNEENEENIKMEESMAEKEDENSNINVIRDYLFKEVISILQKQPKPMLEPPSPDIKDDDSVY